MSDSLIARLKLRAFDILKKRSMDRYYRHGGTWSRHEEPLEVSEAISLVSDRHYARCLDVGAGLGHYTEAVSPISDEVLAIDISEPAIAQAKKRLSKLQNVTFAVKNLRDIDESWGSFDLIILGEVLYYLGDIRFPDAFSTLIKNISDTLADNGRILLVNYISQGRSEQELRKYEETFAANGLQLEVSKVLHARDRDFLITVLHK